MATPYEEVYDVFLSKVTDPHFINREIEDVEEDCRRFMSRAIAKFTSSKQDLSDRDEQEGSFNIKLTDLEKEILGSMMMIEWLSPQVYNILNTKQFLGDKDYAFYSQANHIDKLIDLKEQAEDDVNRLFIEYNIDGLEGLN